MPRQSFLDISMEMASILGLRSSTTIAVEKTSDNPWMIAIVVYALFQTIIVNNNQTNPLFGFDNNETLNRFVELYIIPAYVLFVVLYLTTIYFTRIDVASLLLGWNHQQSSRQLVEEKLKATAANKLFQSKQRNRSVSSRQDDNRDASLIDANNNNQSSTATTAATDVVVYEEANKDTFMPINLSGTYKLISNHNADAFLEAQGVPWALRRTASSAKPIHKISHTGNVLTICIEVPKFGFKTETSYIINGPPVETEVRGRIFHDHMTYLMIPSDNNDDDCDNEDHTNNENVSPLEEELVEDGAENGGTTTTATSATTTTISSSNGATTDSITNGRRRTSNDSRAKKCIGIVVTKRCEEENYTVTNERVLSDDQQTITLTGTAIFAPEFNKPTVVGKQIFERIPE